MLISALNDYYDVLVRKGLIPEECCCVQGVDYLVHLSPEGRITAITDWRERREVKIGGKTEVKLVHREVVMPRRCTKKSRPNVIEHRPAYLFGCSYSAKSGGLIWSEGSTEDRNHAALVGAVEEFFCDVHSPVAQAYLHFVQRWNPQEDIHSPAVAAISKQLMRCGFVFCLEGEELSMLHEDPETLQKWRALYHASRAVPVAGSRIAQCAVTGERAEISRVHNTIFGLTCIDGNGKAALISNNMTSVVSYGQKQSDNACISTEVMVHYADALNYLIRTPSHRVVIGDLMILFWAKDGNVEAEDLFGMVMGKKEAQSADRLNWMIQQLGKRLSSGSVKREQLRFPENVDADTQFFVAGIKMQQSRISLRFFYQNQLGALFENVARHQEAMRVMEEGRPVTLMQIRDALRDPRRERNQGGIEKKTMGVLMENTMRSILGQTSYPISLLSNVVFRVLTDHQVTRVRMGIIRAYLNHMPGRREEETMAAGLDRDNRNPAYLCGRLFAVLQMAQERAAYPKKLSRTIKDNYFTGVAQAPAMVFPTIIRLVETSMQKMRRNGREGSAVFFEKKVLEITGLMQGEFPRSLTVVEQGKFLLGYYQELQTLYQRAESQEEEGNVEGQG